MYTDTFLGMFPENKEHAKKAVCAEAFIHGSLNWITVENEKL